jgi:hypothetical protein
MLNAADLARLLGITLERVRQIANTDPDLPARSLRTLDGWIAPRSRRMKLRLPEIRLHDLRHTYASHP